MKKRVMIEYSQPRPKRHHPNQVVYERKIKFFKGEGSEIEQAIETFLAEDSVVCNGKTYERAYVSGKICGCSGKCGNCSDCSHQ